MSIRKVLQQREQVYGNYLDKADIIQSIKNMMRNYDEWYELDADMQESLDMIASKIGRIIVGDPKHIDNWVDIAGYSQLIVDRLVLNPTKSKANNE